MQSQYNTFHNYLIIVVVFVLAVGRKKKSLEFPYNIIKRLLNI